MAKKPPKQKRNNDGSFTFQPKVKPRDCRHPNYTTMTRSDNSGWGAQCPSCGSTWFIPTRNSE